MSKLKGRKRIQYRIRKKIQGTPQRPRLSVFRSNKNIYCQIIDDVNHRTIVSADSRTLKIGGDKRAVAAEVGKALAAKAQDHNIESVVFDRGGYLYHGRIKALADGAREGGLKF